MSRCARPPASRDIEGSDILLAGRVPNTAGIGLDETGVELDVRGYIKVNDRLETSAPGIWAIGECAGSPHFTHVSVDDFRVIRDNLAGGNRSTRDRLVGDDRILGFTMIGPEAGEVRTAVQAAMLGDLTYQRLRDAAITH